MIPPLLQDVLKHRHDGFRLADGPQHSHEPHQLRDFRDGHARSVPSVVEGRSKAKVFNQDGLLGAHAISPAPASGPMTSLARGAEEGAREATASDTPSACAPVQEVEPGAFLGPLTRNETSPSPVRTPRVRQPSVAQSAVPAAAMGPDEVGAAFEEPASPARPAARPRQPDRPAAKSSLHVALHALEKGLQVVAQVDALGHDERVRMREEIAALLAEHGLSAHAIEIRAKHSVLAPHQRSSG